MTRNAGLAKTVISRERAQDWINSVLNPVLAGLRRELRFLPQGPWHWHHRARRFEYLAPIEGYVADLYRDSYEDFLAKHRPFRKRFEAHDRALTHLAHAVERGFDRLMGSSGSAWRAALEAKLAPSNKDDVPYLVSYLAANVVELPSNYSSYEVYNASSDLRSDDQRIIDDELASAQRDAKTLHGVSKRLHDDLVALRTRLADQYGARIMPADSILAY